MENAVLKSDRLAGRSRDRRALRGRLSAHPRTKNAVQKTDRLAVRKVDCLAVRDRSAAVLISDRQAVQIGAASVLSSYCALNNRVLIWEHQATLISDRQAVRFQDRIS